MHWYVQVENQAYGPYSDAQMQSFVSEGRVGESSLISNAPESGFFNAIAYDVFKLWAGTGQPMAVGAETQMYQQPTPYALQPSHAQAQSYAPTPVDTAPNPYSPIPEPVTPIAPIPSYGTPASQQIDAAAHTNVFLVMAEIRSEGAMGFLKALQDFGVAQRIGDTVWLLRSASTVEQLRNALSQTLTRQDRLFILDSGANKTAWFNIGADLDSRIRELWNVDEH